MSEDDRPARLSDFAEMLGIGAPDDAVGAKCPRCGTAARIEDWLVMRSACEICTNYAALCCPHCYVGYEKLHEVPQALVFLDESGMVGAPSIPDW